jgi:O-antigen chain-terminating methyltransferase
LDEPRAVVRVASEESRRDPRIEEFLDEPTRDLAAWEWLWGGDHRFPARSHRRFGGGLIVVLKKLLRPFFAAPQQEDWDRQRTFNLILLETLRERAAAQETLRRKVDEDHEGRLRHLEAVMREGFDDVMAHNDALFARVDQKLDRYRHDTRELWGQLGAALALVGSADSPVTRSAALTSVREAHGEADYVEFEARFRGTSDEIERRLTRYLPLFDGTGEVLDLGCGRGEALDLLGRNGISARGVDASERMVEICRSRGLRAEAGDAAEVLARTAAGSLRGVVSFHVVEHLRPEVVERLVRLAFRALTPGGVLALETPNPLSLVVAARNFWLDPTHLRPVHPDALQSLCERAGFGSVERWDLQPFAEADRLPEIRLEELAPEARPLADRVNRLRDRLDDLLFGFQDYAIVARKS